MPFSHPKVVLEGVILTVISCWYRGDAFFASESWSDPEVEVDIGSLLGVSLVSFG